MEVVTLYLCCYNRPGASRESISRADGRGGRMADKISGSV